MSGGYCRRHRRRYRVSCPHCDTERVLARAEESSRARSAEERAALAAECRAIFGEDGDGA